MSLWLWPSCLICCWCSTTTDEAPFLREWIEFHRLVGVDKFYFYSNESKDRYKAVLHPYIESGVATLIEQPVVLSPNGKQAITQCHGASAAHTHQHTSHLVSAAYARCLKDYGAQSRWMGFFDVDEFLYPTNAAHETLWPGKRHRSIDRHRYRSMNERRRCRFAVLQQFESFGGLVVRNALYGSSGYINPPLVRRVAIDRSLDLT